MFIKKAVLIVSLREATKKVLFLVDGPIRPSPLGLVTNRTSYKEKKRRKKKKRKKTLNKVIFSLVDNPLPSPSPLSGLPTNKKTFFTASLIYFVYVVYHCSII